VFIWDVHWANTEISSKLSGIKTTHPKGKVSQGKVRQGKVRALNDTYMCVSRHAEGAVTHQSTTQLYNNTGVFHGVLHGV